MDTSIPAERTVKHKVQLLCLSGLVLSIYAAYVEVQAEADSNYVALCDVNQKITCTAVFKTQYGKGFGLIAPFFGDDSMWNQPNGILGACFYLVQLLLASVCRNFYAVMALFCCSLVANAMSIYLSYLLYFVLEYFCIICVAIYTVNLTCLWQIWSMFGLMEERYHLSEAENAINEIKKLT